jgi:hypothetical protein
MNIWFYIPRLHVTDEYSVIYFLVTRNRGIYLAPPPPPPAPVMCPYISRLTEEHIGIFLFYIIPILPVSPDG